MDWIQRSEELFHMILDPKKRPDVAEMKRSYALVKRLRNAAKRRSAKKPGTPRICGTSFRPISSQV
jgi:hypothetical protein